MRILFHLPRTNVLRHFDSVVLSLANFITPHGWQQPATPLLAAAIARLAPGRSSGVRRCLGAGARRP